MSTNQPLSPRSTFEDSAHWRRVFGDASLSSDSEEVLQQGSPANASGCDRPCDTLLVYRFDDECPEAFLGHRTLFSAREEDEHPDLVFTDE